MHLESLLLVFVVFNLPFCDSTVHLGYKHLGLFSS